MKYSVLLSVFFVISCSKSEDNFDKENSSYTDTKDIVYDQMPDCLSAQDEREIIAQFVNIELTVVAPGEGNSSSEYILKGGPTHHKRTSEFLQACNLPEEYKVYDKKIIIELGQLYETFSDEKFCAQPFIIFNFKE